MYDFAILFWILIPSTSIWFLNHVQLTDLLVYGQKVHPICQIFVQKISYLKMGQDLENKTFRFVKLSARQQGHRTFILKESFNRKRR